MRKSLSQTKLESLKMTAEQKAQSFREIVEEYVFVSIDVETIVNTHDRELQALKAELARVRGIAEKVLFRMILMKHPSSCQYQFSGKEDDCSCHLNFARQCAKELKGEL